MFCRSYGKPACRLHNRCFDTTEEHWRLYDHPSCHPFICASKLKTKDEAPASKRPKCDVDPDVHMTDSEPLRIGESVTVSGSGANEYDIKRHPDKNGVPFYWCTCPSRKFHGTKGDNTCKHIDALRNGQQIQAKDIKATNVVRVPIAPNKSTATFPVALAEKYASSKHNPIGMVFMEKYDGFYGHYDVATRKIFTRSGNEMFVPTWFIDQMPSLSVTGEVYGGKGKFNQFSGLFNSNDTANPQWKDVQFMIFDVVDEAMKPMSFKDRMELVKNFQSANIQVVSIHDCTSRDQLDAAFRSVVSAGGEGLMLRKDAPYRSGRSTDLLKYKKSETVDGKVVGYTNGTGRFQDFVGSVILQTREGKTFKCVPPDRTNPPLLGTFAEVECFEVTSAGVPRHPRWLRTRTDISF